MASLTWAAWQSQWSSGAKVDFDGYNKYIIVHPEVTTLDIRTDVYSSWVDWHEYTAHDGQRWPFAITYSGMDALPGGGETGGIFFLYNGWKLIIDFNKVAVTGVLYSRDYATAYWSPQGSPLYPATVAALVNNTVNNTVTTIPVQADPSLIAREILATPINTPMDTNSLGEFLIKKLLTVAKFLGLK